jgi:hypothetical protein
VDFGEKLGRGDSITTGERAKEEHKKRKELLDQFG